MSHYKVKCSCGTVIEQCRCPDANKPVLVRLDGCAECRRRAAQPDEQEAGT